MGDMLDDLHAALWRAPSEVTPALKRALVEIFQLRTLVADLLEWADHQPTCLIHDDDICDCGYDGLAAEWAARRG